MKTKTFNNLNEIQPYYKEFNNTYVFKDNDKYIDIVILNFDLEVAASIDAAELRARKLNVKNLKTERLSAWDVISRNIEAHNINCDWLIRTGNITAWDIKARDINAKNIQAYDIKTKYITANDIRAQNINAEVIHARDIIAYKTIVSCDISARNIEYGYICCAYSYLNYTSIVGTENNAKYIVLRENLEKNSDGE